MLSDVKLQYLTFDPDPQKTMMMHKEQKTDTETDRLSLYSRPYNIYVMS